MPKIIDDEDVYRATLKVLSAEGYAGATTRLLADAAGINETTLFRKYGSKPELVVAAIRQGAFQVAPGSMDYTGNAEADLLRSVEAWARAIERDGHLLTLIMSEMSRDPALRKASTGPSSMMRDLGALLERYRRDGVLVTDEDPGQAVASLLGPLMIIHMLRGTKRRTAPARLDLRSHVRRFLKGRS